MTRPLTILSCMLLPILALAQAPPVEQIVERMVPPVEQILERMGVAREQKQASVRAYSVTRHYKLFHNSPVAKSEIQAQITFLPPNRKNFRIASSSGGYGEKIVRRVLEGETKANKDDSVVEISSRNYDFRFVREEGEGMDRAFVLELLPKREEKLLVAGHAWVDANTYLVRRVEGRLAKSPSFWVKQVVVVLTYGDVSGMWLQTATQAVADVRLKGRYTMTARDLNYQTGSAMASVAAPVAKPRPRRSPLQPALNAVLAP